MSDYIYPDKSDVLTNLYITTKSNEKYWEESENNVLQKIIEKIKEIEKSPRLLDLGCGQGRLFNVFYNYVSHITGLEPDYNRYLDAEMEAKKVDSKKIDVINGYIDCLKDDAYDVVIISHIFQHIPIEETKKTLDCLQDMITKDGYIFITTTFSDMSKDSYKLVYLKDNKYFEENVTENEFVKKSAEEGILPTREFSYKTMEILAKNSGFVIEDMFLYHFKVQKDGEVLATVYDEKMNKEKKYQEAKDVLYVLRKKN